MQLLFFLFSLLLLPAQPKQNRGLTNPLNSNDNTVKRMDENEQRHSNWKKQNQKTALSRMQSEEHEMRKKGERGQRQAPMQNELNFYSKWISK